MPRGTVSPWDEEQLLHAYTGLSDDHKNAVQAYIHRLATPRPRFEWSRLARAWPNIWDVVADMDGLDFEDFVAILCSQKGYQYAPNLRRRRDQGVDLFRLHRGGTEAIIECKLRRKYDVGSPVVRSLAGACAEHGVAYGMVFTNREFTRDAKQTRDRLDAEAGPRIRLVDYREIDGWIKSKGLRPLKRLFADPNLAGLQDLLRASGRTQQYVQARLLPRGRS